MQKLNKFIVRGVLDSDIGDKTNMQANMAKYLQTMNLAEYWTYPGSLTTPGCNEAVTWMVFNDAFRMSDSYVRAELEYLQFKE